MKKNKFGVGIVACVLALATTLTACGDDVPSLKKDYEGEWVFTSEVSEQVVPSDTNIVLAENGNTEYKIVVTETRDDYINQGLIDLQEFFEQSTGAKISYVADTGLSFNENDKVISLGRTSLLEGSGITADLSELGEDGFIIKTKGNNLFICGGYNTGTMYGIYDFLDYQLGVKFWGYEEITVPKNQKVFVKDFSLKSIPAFDDRVLGNDYLCYPTVNSWRLKLDNNQGPHWLEYTHNYLKLLPKDKYFAEHRDWYSTDGQQLCLTNPEIIQPMVDSVKEQVELQMKDWLSYLYFGIFQEDVATFCNCERCQAEVKLYRESGVTVRFINKLAEQLNPWAKEKYPDKTIKWVMYSYQKTVEPPSKKNDKGEYVALDESVKTGENVVVQIAHSGSNWWYSIVDPEYNERTSYQLNGWACCCDEVLIYTYNAVFNNQWLTNFDYSYIKESYQIYEQMGAAYLFDQSPTRKDMPFYELSSYVRAKMLWNPNLDVEKLIDDFINVYYKAAAPKVREYFDFLRARYGTLDREYAERGEQFKILAFTFSYPEWVSETYWPKDWLLRGIKIYDEALELAETIEDQTDRERVIRRVKANRTQPLYLLIELYRDQIGTAMLEKYINEFSEHVEANSMVYYTEHGHKENVTIQGLINGWKASLNK